MCLDKGATNGSTDGARDIHAPPPTQISPDKPSEVVLESMMYLPDDLLVLPNLNIPEADDINIWDYNYNSIDAPFSLAFPPSPPNSGMMRMEIDQTVNDNKDKVLNGDNNEVEVTGNSNVVASNNKDEAVAPTAVVYDLDNEAVTQISVVNRDHNNEVANLSSDVEVMVKRKRGRPRKYQIKDSVVPLRCSGRKRRAAATISSSPCFPAISGFGEEPKAPATIHSPLSPDISGARNIKQSVSTIISEHVF